MKQLMKLKPDEVWQEEDREHWAVCQLKEPYPIDEAVEETADGEEEDRDK